MEEIPYSVFQASGFHLSRACNIGLENGSYIYAAIRNGDSIILNQKEHAGDKASKARSYVMNRLAQAGRHPSIVRYAWIGMYRRQRGQDFCQQAEEAGTELDYIRRGENG